jgi:hypothetical protein
MEVAKVRIEHSLVIPQDDQLARLIGSDKQRDVALLEQLRQVARVYAP